MMGGLQPGENIPVNDIRKQKHRNNRKLETLTINTQSHETSMFK
jgi:hypothetical protein